MLHSLQSLNTGTVQNLLLTTDTGCVIPYLQQQKIIVSLLALKKSEILVP